MAIAERTGEQPDRVGYMVRSWIRDGLLPRPKIVPIPGSRGTRGDYSEAVLIGYLAVKLLRPKGKPLTIRVEWPTREDMEAMKEGLRLTAKYMEWLQKEHGLSLSEIVALQDSGQLPPPPPALLEERALLAARPKRKPYVHLIRLNTKTLARLIPITRGEVNPEIWLNAGSLTPADLAEAIGARSAVQAYAEYKAVSKIWEAVAEAETGIKPSDVIPIDNDVIAYQGKEEIWRLTESKWANIKNGPGTENELEGVRQAEEPKVLEKGNSDKLQTETKEVFNNDHTKRKRPAGKQGGQK